MQEASKSSHVVARDMHIIGNSTYISGRRQGRARIKVAPHTRWEEEEEISFVFCPSEP